MSSCGPASATGGSTRNTNGTGNSGQLVYAAIGASDTFGYGTNDPYEDNWATDLAGRLGSNVHLVNLGIPGIDLHQALSVELPVALDVHPRLVTIWLAVNDLADNVPVDSYAHDLDVMLSRLQKGAPQARIAMANVPDLTLLSHFSTYNQQRLRQQVAAYNTVIASAVARYHVILVDLQQQGYNLAEHPEFISPDGLHPSVIGYAQLADIFYAALQK